VRLIVGKQGSMKRMGISLRLLAYGGHVFRQQRDTRRASDERHAKQEKHDGCGQATSPSVGIPSHYSSPGIASLPPILNRARLFPIRPHVNAPAAWPAVPAAERSISDSTE
jgi:hypothetical protein